MRHLSTSGEILSELESDGRNKQRAGTVNDKKHLEDSVATN